MARNNPEVNPGEKQRMRDQIRQQVEEFLHKGGRIDVMDRTPPRRQAGERGSVWHGQDDFQQLLD
ncbi:hypothetical protein FV139_12585 [Parahaliea maris]|uniref:Transcriptional regulator SutA RNAP-binding domain-containing protein n=1 Tax=Parahaliea maris TaxID=2716870 RepID=A0A5C8ZYV9_9GAMM|nr:hypothetical protein [Parahaliea maris]TXS92802.1 hypothetical protein FV139_12585 [Parahaliea maris]